MDNNSECHTLNGSVQINREQPTVMSSTAMDAPPSRRVLVFVLLLLNEFFYGWAWNSVDVLRPFLQKTLGLTLLQAGSSYSAQGAGALCGAVVMGQLADRIGRRYVLSLISFGYGVVLLGGLLVHTYPGLLAQRVALGIFMGASFPVSVSIYVTLFAPRARGRLSGMMNAFFSLSVIVLGLALGLVRNGDWTVLLWIGGVPPILLSMVFLILLPADRKPGSTSRTTSKFPIAELFRPEYRRQTIALAVMAGLNFFAYQAFSGWFTTYLLSVRHFTVAAVGQLVAWQFTANIAGGFLWGWASDRWGRRFNATGFILAALAIGVFLCLPDSMPLMLATGLIYGLTFCSSVVWGPWFAELYPEHLRSTAASIFNWGRLISFFAPLLTASVAHRFGLVAAMSLSSIGFMLAAAVWLTQKETLVRR